MIKCGKCREKHATVAEVRACYNAQPPARQTALPEALPESNRVSFGIQSKDAPVRRVTEDGMYRNPETGDIYKVQLSRNGGNGRWLYAKRLVVRRPARRDAKGRIVEAAKVSFEYAPRMVWRLRPEWRLSSAEARDFGALYGTCCDCGQTLTRESSVAHGYGPTCAENNGWPYNPKAVPAT